MKFGVTLTPFNPPEREYLLGYRKVVRAARDAGFSSVVAGENNMSHPNWTPAVSPLLAALASDLGPDMRAIVGIILLSLRNPVVTAEELTVLDHATGGHLVVGVGLGWRDTAFSSMGQPKAGSVNRLIKNVEVLRAIWAGGPVHFDSEYCKLDGAQAAEVPIQRPGPPIWFAGNTDKAVVRAAQLGDAWLLNPHSKLTVLDRQLEIYNKARADAGLPAPKEIPLRRDVFLSQDPKRAWLDAEKALTPLYEALIRWGHDSSMPSDDHMAFPFDNLAKDRFLIGSPDEILSNVERVETTMGVTELMVRLGYPGMSTDEFCRRITEFGKLVIEPYSAK